MQQGKRFYLTVLALLGWVALIGQLYLIIVNRKIPLAETIIEYFSYFTVLTNMLTAVCATVLLLHPSGKWGRFFSRASTLAALAVYITIVGLVYNLILRFLWAPQGFQRIVDELLHSVNPVLFIIYWFVYASKEGLVWKQIQSWQLYPLAYVVYILIRGALSGFYPYPFLDVAKLGYPKAALNGVVLIILFVAMSSAFMAIGRYVSGKRKPG